MTKNDPEPNQTGHDYQLLALDRERLASNQLKLAKRYQELSMIPLKVHAMQTWSETDKPPFSQRMKGQTNNPSCHQPFMIPPANEPSIFDEKM